MKKTTKTKRKQKPKKKTKKTPNGEVGHGRCD